MYCSWKVHRPFNVESTTTAQITENCKVISSSAEYIYMYLVLQQEKRTCKNLDDFFKISAIDLHVCPETRDTMPQSSSGQSKKGRSVMASACLK